MAKRTCSIEGCDDPAKARGWCNAHYHRWRIYSDPLGRPEVVSRPETCTVDDCGKKAAACGWCHGHYHRWRLYGDPLKSAPPRNRRLPPRYCAVKGCDKRVNARGWCGKHYYKWRMHGDPEAVGSCEVCGGTIAIGEGLRFCQRTAECRRQSSRAARAKNPEQARVRDARWRAENPDKVRAAVRRYKARTDRKCVHPGCEEFAIPYVAYCRTHGNERAARYSARVRSRLARMLYRRQDGMCPDAAHGGCGLPLESINGNHVDHLIPTVRGGSDDEWNLQLMHPACNHRKSDRLVPAARAAAKEHGVTLLRSDGGRPRRKAA